MLMQPYFNQRGRWVLIVIRDHSGSHLAAWGGRSADVTSPDLAKALAVRRAIALAHEEGLTKIILASDCFCLAVIQRIHSPVTDRFLSGTVIEDIKASSLGFTSCILRHVLRVLNVAAH
jgi:hypothetical protein